MQKRYWIAFISVVLLLGHGVGLRASTATPANAGEPVEQTIFYADSLQLADGASALYEVTFDPTTPQAILTEVVRLDPSLGLGAWDHIDTLAASPDGSQLYFVDSGATSNPPSRLGTYNRETGVLRSIGVLNFSDTGIAPVGLNTTDLAAITANGDMYLGRVDGDNNALYKVNVENADATRVGLVRSASTMAVVDLFGGDLAFDNTGRLFVWTNAAADGAPRGLYRALNADLPTSGDILVEHLGGEAGSMLFTGLAFLNAGTGDLLASVRPSMFPELDRSSGEITTTWTNPDTMHAGDMSTGQLAACTRTIGYHKTHDWNGRTITINGEIIDQETGQQILNSATSRNFSMLFAQLIGAKLNCSSCGGVIHEAEAFLLAAGVFTAQFDAPFADGTERREAIRLSRLLDEYNNSDICDSGGNGNRGPEHSKKGG